MTKEKPATELLKQLMAENPKVSERELLKLFRAEIWGEEEKYMDEFIDFLIENERARAG
jgi:F0F1-type ATP synthase delta subunit